MEHEHWAADLPGTDRPDNEENALDLFSGLEEEPVAEEPPKEEPAPVSEAPLSDPTQRVQTGSDTPIYTPPVHEPEPQPAPQPAPEPRYVAPEPEEDEDEPDDEPERDYDDVDYNRSLKRLILPARPVRKRYMTGRRSSV